MVLSQTLYEIDQAAQQKANQRSAENCDVRYLLLAFWGKSLG